MAKKEIIRESTRNDIEVLANWMAESTLCRGQDQFDVLRKIVANCAADAAEFYEDDDLIRAREVIIRFASEMDDMARFIKKDQEEHKKKGEK